MAITYGSQTGTLIDSFAMDEILGDQSQQSGNRQVVVSDDISTAGNGQIGTLYTTYVDRKLIINLEFLLLKKDLSNETPIQTRVYSLCYDSTNDIIVAGTYPDAQIWASTDGGETWTLKKDLSNESPGQTAVRSLVYDSTNDIIIAGTVGDAQIWISSDGAAATWTLKKDLSNESPSQSEILSLAYDSTNDIIIAGTSPDAQIWISSDGAAATWTLKKDLGNETPAQTDLPALTYDSDNDVIIAGTYPDGQIWISSDGAAATWTLKKDLSNEVLSQDGILALTYDSTNGIIIAGTRPRAQIWTSKDGGDTWVFKRDLYGDSPKEQSSLWSLTFDSDNDIIYAGTGFFDAQIWQSLDGGENWSIRKSLGVLTDDQDDVYCLVWDSTNKRLVAGTRPDGQLWVGNSGDEQQRIVVSQANGTGNTIILTVNEDWESNPVSGDLIHVFYNVDDIETGGAGAGINLNTKTGLYELSNILTLGDGTDEAGLLLHESVGFEIDDRGSSIGFFIENNARFDVGYEEAEKAVSGGIVTGYNNTDGEPWIEWKEGSNGIIQDALLWSQLNVLLLQHQNGAAAVFRDVKFISGTYGSLFFGATLLNCAIEGEGGANEFIRLSHLSVIEGLNLIKTNGFHTEASNTTDETITIKDVVFIGNNVLITVEQSKHWDVINPVWTVNTADQGDLDFLSSVDNDVNERYSLDVVVQKADGTKLADALVIVYENTQTDDLVIKKVTPANGFVYDSWIYKTFVDNAGTSLTATTYGGHALRVDKWLYSPFVSTRVSNLKFDGSVVLLPDGDIVQTTQATAKSAGSSVTWNEDTNPSSIIKFTGGSGTLAVGNTVTGVSGADGIVTKIVDGNSVAGTVHLKTRDAVDFSGTEGLSNGSGWTATLTSGSQQDFSIWIDANSISMQALYDYLAAITSETVLGTDGELIHEWGRDSQPRALQKGGAGFFTERSYLKGIFITNFGAGTIEKFTDDAGNAWTPPVSRSFKFTLVPSITGYEWRIYTVTTLGSLAGAVEIAGEESASADNQTYGYVYSSDQFIAVQIIPQPDEDYVEKVSYYTLVNQNQDVSITLEKDTNN